MMVPTHIVVDTHDGWTFWKDADGKLFTEGTATHFAAQRNNEMKPEHRSYIVATVKPIRSHEYLDAMLGERMRELRETPPMIEAPRTCILTGEDGENADDCTTHDHE